MSQPQVRTRAEARKRIRDMPRVTVAADDDAFALDRVDGTKSYQFIDLRQAVQQWVADNFVVAGYGAMEIKNGPIPGNDIGLVYDPLTYFTDILGTTRGVTLDTTTGEFVFLVQGRWNFSINIAIEHNEVNAGRSFNLRFWNVTDGTDPGAQMLIPTGRNQPATAGFPSGQVDIPPALVGKSFRVEIGGGDDYTAVSYESLSINIQMIGEWRDPLP